MFGRPIRTMGARDDRMSTQEFSQEKIRNIGLEALARELGATGLIRFLQIYEQGSGDYTSERCNILPTQTAA